MKVPVWCMTPHRGACLHRFFDTCPISPSGRYLALFGMPFENRLNAPGDLGHVVLIDLQTGEERVVAQTAGWEPQLGANLNWGIDDHHLYFNDVDCQTWEPQLVQLDPLRGTSERTKGGVYHVSPDGRFAAAASLEKMIRTQIGYGVLIPREKIGQNIGAPEDDGLYVTNLNTGERRLVLSLAEAARYIPELDGGDLDDWELYGFHAKWSPQSDRLIFTIRRFPRHGAMRFNLLSSDDPKQQIRYDVLTLRPDGTEVCNAVPARHWEPGGHHINWFPHGKKLSMNLGGFANELRFVQVAAHGDDLKLMHADAIGSGHPTVYPGERNVLTDAYAGEPVAFEDDTVPLRWVDLQSGRERCLARIGVRTEPQPNNALRVDPHPAWDRSWRYVVFNGVAPGENTRRVFLADLESVVNSSDQ
ncbi:hypothetical protein [Thalassobacterium sedimentorum]|nr:hypothetical protein [Coraliomargarita sp. SDUM461004]